MAHAGAGAGGVHRNLVILLQLIIQAGLDSYGHKGTHEIGRFCVQIQHRQAAISQLARIKIQVLGAIKAATAQNIEFIGAEQIII